MNTPLLQIEDLHVHFPLAGRKQACVRAVNGVSFHVEKGETLGLVGESGCGKTTTGRAVLRLIEPTAGQIFFEDVDVRALGKKELRQFRSQMQIVFQDPYASLNPRLRVGDALVEAMEIHKIGSPSRRPALAQELLERVGLNPDYAKRYPHEFSGGQRQRIGIARALAVNPKLIVCDEPVSALDVSVQAQVVNLLMDLQEELGLSYLFIAHDLSVVKHICHRVAVMYLGRIVEIATVDDLYANPKHPYTQALLSAIPIPDPTQRQAFVPLAGELPSPLNPPLGCAFHTRCAYAKAECREQQPQLQAVAPGHSVACHQVGQCLAKEGRAQCYSYYDLVCDELC
ncbi:MAG: dipeptide ABC transporter ATP-binding protein [Firmicutes bacterium]|nr:dipeptide ABC transporter ATP-binding protein [Bacillota bacterium]